MADTNIPSIGDVLMLSQVAWRTGRAFSSGRKTTPREFIQIDAELNGVAKALKLLAETLFADPTEAILSQVDKRTQSGIAVIILSCKRTLEDLESLIDQYQVIKKNPTAGGYTVERSWSDLVVMNYQHMMWTSEGGTIHQLREILRMHTATISLVRQALQRYIQLDHNRCTLSNSGAVIPLRESSASSTLSPRSYRTCTICNLRTTCT
jgi:hypothetical protein